MALLDSELSPYLRGPYAPIARESAAELRPIAGQIPPDLSGLLVRNGPNPRFPPRGRYHWFDGDGMLHAVAFHQGRAAYRCRWVRTAHLERELAAGQPLWSGVMESVRDNPPDAPYKDTANTDVVFHCGRLLALSYLAGTPMALDPRSLETLGPARFSGQALPMSAHAKPDPRTGELHFFDFGFRPPFMHYGVASAEGQLLRRVPLELPGPRLPHDMALTERFAVLMDLPVVYDQHALEKKRWVTRFDRELPARFALISRQDEAAPVRWFEAAPCYIYHLVNAWEEEDALVMVGCRVEDPIPPPDPRDGAWAQMLANLRVRARLHRWRLDLRTGATREEPLDDLNTEFPMIDRGRLGRPTRYSYNVRLASTPTLVFDGLVKYDLERGTSELLEFAPGQYGSETPFAPRVGGRSEDDGYLLTFLQDERAGRSELWITDARRISAGPVARLQIPTRVPCGFHATFVPGQAMGGDGDA